MLTTPQKTFTPVKMALLHRLCLHGFECLSYEPYPGFHHIQDMLLTCTQRILVLHVPVYKINTSIPVSDYCILFVQALVTFDDDLQQKPQRCFPY